MIIWNLNRLLHVRGISLLIAHLPFTSSKNHNVLLVAEKRGNCISEMPALTSVLLFWNGLFCWFRVILHSKRGDFLCRTPVKDFPSFFHTYSRQKKAKRYEKSNVQSKKKTSRPSFFFPWQPTLSFPLHASSGLNAVGSRRLYKITQPPFFPDMFSKRRGIIRRSLYLLRPVNRQEGGIDKDDSWHGTAQKQMFRGPLNEKQISHQGNLSKRPNCSVEIYIYFSNFVMCPEIPDNVPTSVDAVNLYRYICTVVLMKAVSCRLPNTQKKQAVI